MSGHFQVNKQFVKFKGKDVIVSLKNWEEIEGKVVALDNFLNLVLDGGEGLRVIKSGKIAFISIKG